MNKYLAMLLCFALIVLMSAAATAFGHWRFGDNSPFFSIPLMLVMGTLIGGVLYPHLIKR